MLRRSRTKRDHEGLPLHNGRADAGSGDQRNSEFDGKIKCNYNKQSEKKHAVSRFCSAPVMIGFLCFCVSIEMGYIIALGAFSNGEFWDFYFGSARRRGIATTRTMDNYYSRPHIRDPVPLIVGGSDGSGTRAFVHILEHLDVPMVVEDRGTMDVHGREICHGEGWPALVTKVLNATRSASYDLESMPAEIRKFAQAEISKFLRSIQFAGELLVDASGSDRSWATGVSWGFKAPVSMLLLPFFRDQLPSMKFLHIVRDGRDIAVCENRSPVHKFYTAYYKDADLRHKRMMAEEHQFDKDARNSIKAMQLWNGWNKEVYDYGVRFSDGQRLEVLVMRTEDLIQSPLESISLLADFVGSLKSMKDICCLSRLSASDLGRSDRDPFVDLDEGGQEVDDLIGRRFFDPHGFGEVRKRFSGFARKKPAEPGQRNEMSASRRLLENIGTDASERAPNVMKSEGKLAVANHPQPIANQLLNRISEVASMQNQLLQQRVDERRKANELQSADEVKSRYGKWAAILDGKPALLSRLFLEGSEALSLFGYEPAKEFMDLAPHPELLLQCDGSINCPV